MCRQRSEYILQSSKILNPISDSGFLFVFMIQYFYSRFHVISYELPQSLFHEKETDFHQSLSNSI